MSNNINPNKHQAKKRFGQNFLVSEYIINQIISSLAINEEDYILEIGPGLGAISSHMINLCKKLYAVEIDKDLAPKLIKQFGSCANFKLFNQDILEFSLEENIYDELPKNNLLRVVGNIPYNISSPIIFKFLSNLKNIKDLNFMVQEEVANRLASNPGSKNYGRLSIMVQYFCVAEKLVDVDASCFSPPPKVQSAFIRLVPKDSKDLLANDFALFADIVKIAFNQRRKTVANVLKQFVTKDELVALNINPSLRPEDLKVIDYVNISNYCSSNQKN